MKKMLSTLALAAILSVAGLYGTAQAGCGPCGAHKEASAEKVADKSCGEKCATECSSTKNVAATSEDVDMAKGGADDSKEMTGYGLDQKVPDFTLTDTEGNKHSLSDYRGKVVALVFYNQKCPYVVEAHKRISKFADKYEEKGVKVLAIDAGINNDPEEISEHAETVAYPVLLNRESDLARKFQATRTPEVYVIDQEGYVRYTGKFDSGQEVDADGNREAPAKEAIKALMNGEDVPVKKTKAFGCTIKFNPETAS